MIKAVICLLIFFVSFALDPFRALFERRFYYNRNFRNLQVFSLRYRIPWGLRAPRPAPEGFPLWTPTGETAILGRHTASACDWGIRYMEGFWPIESRENPRWESLLSPEDYSPAFPGCFASGLAAFSRRARSTAAASLAVFSSTSGEIACLLRQAISASVGPGRSSPWWGAGQSPADPFAGFQISE